ncbi:MAG: hypothetical protein WC164_01560 [Patescibacteria group bacterium]|nr:hypothetical protein [Patescibacteria group bacterium]
MLWINFLHLYQPANSDPYRIKEANDLSYERIFDALKKNKKIKFTLNISACLVSRMLELGYVDLIKKINLLIERGQIELVGSAAYHPLLPLIKKKEVVRQIKENEIIIKKNFPKAKLKGFFFPEMAYSPEVASIVKKMGYSWIILDEISFNSSGKVDYSQVYKDKKSDLKVVFRSREFSNCYVPDKITNHLSGEDNSKDIIVSATDGELYGLRHNDPRGKFENILKNKKIETVLISDYIKNKKTISISVRKSNWESSLKDLAKKEPYHLWYSQKNKIHLKLWELADLAYNTIERHKRDKNSYWARWHFVRGLASCTFWWASDNDFKHNFGPRAWNPDEIERGVDEFIRSIRSLENSTTKEEKIKAESLLAKTKRMIWTKHWSKR